MKKKIISVIIIMMITTLLIPQFIYATSNITLEKVEDNIVTTKLGEDGNLTRKLLSVDNQSKKITMEINIENIKSDETTTLPSEVMIVIDNSDSMNQNKLSDGTIRKAALINATKSLVDSILTAQSDTKIGIVCFSTGLNTTGTLNDATLLTKPTNNKTNIITAIDSIKTLNVGSGTDIDAGLQVAKMNFDTNNSLNKNMILLTDGLPNVAVGGGDVNNSTKATLQSIVDSKINIVTVMTVDNSTTKIENQAIFGSHEQPNYGEFYYVKDDNLVETITKNVYSDVTVVIENIIKNIKISDYISKEISENYDINILSQPSSGNATIDSENKCVTWSIDKLKAKQKESMQYTLKLKDNYNQSIINKIMPTNQNIKIIFTTSKGENQTINSEISPKVILKDTSTAATAIPQTGEKNSYIIILGIIIISIITGFIIYKNNKLKE